MQEKEVYDYLAKHGVKASVQRVGVMKYLLENLNAHPTVDEIYSALVGSIPTLSKTTVYNTLKLLCDHGVARMLTIDGKNANFDGQIEPHAHFLCSVCGRIDNVFQHEQLITNATRLLPPGYAAQTIDLYYKGVCPHCLGLETGI